MSDPTFPAPPETRRGEVVDTLHGQQVADPYRWLEDPDAPEVVAWVDQQRAHAEQVLDALPEREWFRRTMREIVLRPRAGVVHHLGRRRAVARNDGQQAQNVWYVADTAAELEHGGGIVLLDPNTWSSDGTTSLGGLAASGDGRLLGYAVNEAGSDWQLFRFLDLETMTPLDEPDLVTKFSPIVWLADHRTLPYSLFDNAERTEGTSTTALGGARMLLHTLGEPASDDRELLCLGEHEMALPMASTDGGWLFAAIGVGTEANNRLWAWRQRVVDGRVELVGPVKLVDEPTHEWRLVDAIGDTAWVVTDRDAPLSRVVAIDLAASEKTGELVWREVVPQGDAQIASVVIAGDELIVETLEDAAPVLRRYGLDGAFRGVVDVAGGAVVGIDARPDDAEWYLGLSSVTSPTTCWAVEGDRVRRLDLVVTDAAALPSVQVRRHRAPSTGVEVPYFLITPEDLDVSGAPIRGARNTPDGGADAGPRPTLLYGYGGFRIPVLADYRAIFAGWLAAGGVVAIANLRGGGEYGTEWYEQGKRAHKQHVFDDIIAVAEHLIATGVTTPQQLALHGRSNGGLLVGAAITQRPDLFGAALPTVGVLDLLRFHLFTIGSAWISDYGDPDDQDDFAVSYAYSPLHNVREGTAYPPTLVATGDHDDRVVPLHSHKFTAALQHAQAGDAPVISRIETSTGHGAGKPAQMVADEAADLLAFAAHFTGLTIAQG